MSFNVLIELKKLSTAISSACTECWLEDLLQDSVEKIEADAREIAALKAEIDRLKEDNEVLKGFVERNK